MTKIDFIVILIIITVSTASGFDQLFEYKLKYVKKQKPEKNWTMLSVDKSFSLDQNDANSFLTMPACMKTKNGKIYILENGRHRLIVFSQDGKFLRYLGRRGKGPGDLYHPAWFDFFKENIYIINNNGFDIFGKNLGFKNRVRTFFSISQFSIYDNHIYCPVKTYKKEFPLFLKMDMNGIVKNTINVNDKDMDKSLITKKSKKGFLLNSVDNVVYVPKHWNKIFIFGNDLKLKNKIKIKDDLLNNIENWNSLYLDKMTSRSVWFSNLFASAELCNGRIYLLVNIPRLEIISIDLDGNILDYFYNDHDFKLMRWIDFAVQEKNDKTCFYVMGYSIGDLADDDKVEISVYRLTANGNNTSKNR